MGGYLKEPSESGSPNFPPRVRAYLEALAITGSRIKAAEAANVDESTPRGWRAGSKAPVPGFDEAEAEAMQRAGERLRDEARRRAVEGQKKYLFTKDGDPLKHPDLCDCGHARKAHVKSAAMCLEHECGCEAFVPAPYFEHSYSDKLLEVLLRAAFPGEFADRKEVRKLVGKVDWNLLLDRLPPEALVKLGQGVSPEAVLAELGSAAARLLLAPPTNSAVGGGEGSVTIGGPGSEQLGDAGGGGARRDEGERE